jgi:hypothetical protein
MQAKTVRRIVIALVVSAIAGTATVGAVRHASLSAPAIGVATGEHVNGVPVYRLPTVNVTVSRSAALAEMAKEDAVAMK